MGEGSAGMPEAERGVRFLLVGLWNTVFGYAAFVGAWWLLGPRGVHYLVVTVISFLISVTHNHLVYGRLVFPDRERGLASWVRFVSFYLGSLAFGLVALPLLVELGGLDPVVAQAVLVILSATAAYFGHRGWTFKALRRDPDGSTP